MKHYVIALTLLAALAAGLFVFGPSHATAHTGSPSMVTWSPGQTLNSTDLNNAFAHIHNTFSAGIVNAHLSPSAAIAHSKLATPALVPKAWAVLTAACNGGAAAGTACTVAESSQVTSVTANGTNGQYRINLAYTPTNASFAPIVTVLQDSSICGVDTLATTAPQMLVKCRTVADVQANRPFTIMVMDVD